MSLRWPSHGGGRWFESTSAHQPSLWFLAKAVPPKRGESGAREGGPLSFAASYGWQAILRPLMLAKAAPAPPFPAQFTKPFTSTLDIAVYCLRPGPRAIGGRVWVSSVPRMRPS